MFLKRIIRSTYTFLILSCLLISLVATMLKLTETYKLTSLSFTIDNLYLKWNTSFPAITVCEIFNGEKNWDISEKLYGEDRNRKLDVFLADISFFAGHCYSCNDCLSELSCPDNYTNILQEYRSSCPDLLHDCFWNDEPIDCCETFVPLQTESGLCYSINSIHTTPKYGKQLIMNLDTGLGSLKFIVNEDVQINIHSPYDVPIMEGTHITETVLYGSIKEILLSVMEIITDKAVADISIDQRMCRFYWEMNWYEMEATHPVYELYSYSTCIVRCSNRIQLKYCNCSHHFMPESININYIVLDLKTCDYKGLICLTEHFAAIVKERKKCDCLASCEEPEYNTIYSSPEEFRDDPGSQIIISMIDLPKQRFIRRNVKTNLDIVISVGGLCGLYFGASILTIIDIYYYLIEFVASIKNYLTRK